MLKTNLDLVAEQLVTLINVAGSVTNMKRVIEGDDCKLTGDVGNPLDATMVNALNRIDTILRDDAKWVLPVNDARAQLHAMGAVQIEGSHIDNQAKLGNMAIARKHNEIVIASAIGKLQAEAQVSKPQPGPRRKK